MVDMVLEIIAFPLYGLAIYLPLAGLGSLVERKFGAGILYLLGALVCYSLAVGIGRYFESKGDNFSDNPN